MTLKEYRSLVLEDRIGLIGAAISAAILVYGLILGKS